MFGKQHVDITLTERAKEWIESYKLTSGLHNPIVSIYWARVRGEPEHKWRIGLYERAEINEGWLGIAQDFQFIVLQDENFERLNHKVLDITYDPNNLLVISVTPIP